MSTMSSPHPPYTRFRPGPPTIHLWPMSPKIASLPWVGLGWKAVPLLQYLFSGPSLGSKSRIQMYLQLVHGVVLHSEPSALSITFRRGSAASYRANLVVVGL